MTDRDTRMTRSERDSELNALPKKRSRALPAIALAVGTLVLVANAAGTVWLLVQNQSQTAIDADKEKNKGKNGKGAKDGKADDKQEAREPTYLALEPPFVVNIGEEGQMRFLQVSIEVMTTDKTVIHEVQKHMPMIRNGLVLLLSAQDYHTLSSPEGKERVRQGVREEIQRVLHDRMGSPGISDVYFTSFVMQ